MNKRFISYFASSAFCFAGIIEAREFRTPMAPYREYFHYPLPRPVEDDKCYGVDVWMTPFAKGIDSCYLNKNTRTHESLSGIFFGAPVFTVGQTLVPGSANGQYPLLNIITIAPTYDYSEKSVWFGFNVQRTFGCEKQWNAGVRARFPFRYIKVDLEVGCDLGTGDLREFVRSNPSELVTDDAGNTVTIFDSFAYRLDFLSALPIAVNSTTKFVQYTPTAVGMGTVNVQLPNNSNLSRAPVYVMSFPVGTFPQAPFSLRAGDSAPGSLSTSVNTLPILNADGTGTTGATQSNGNVGAYFGIGQNYASDLATNIPAQSKLWVVPTMQGNGTAAEIMLSARTIQARVNDILGQINTSSLLFLCQNGVDFGTQRNVGIGDFDVEFFANREWCNWTAEAILGFRFPTGARVLDPKKIAKVLAPTGSDHHYEIRVGGMAAWNPRPWFAFKLDAFYNFVLENSEKVAASFKGATIKNIGPTVDADVSWGYFVGDADFTFMVPSRTDVGFNLGYQAYVKRKDKVHFKATTATDFLGTVGLLDPSVIEERTNQVAHKAKIEMFHQSEVAQLYAGWTNVFAGKNASRDTDWYLGMIVFF